MKCGDPHNPDGPGLTGSGRPCKNEVVTGTGRCFMHGGASPTAKFKAEQALALLRMPAIEGLYKVVETLTEALDQFNSTRCATCGYPSGDVEELRVIAQVSAVITKNAQTILDRCQMGPHATIEVKQSDHDLDLRILTPPERERMMVLLSEFESIKAEARKRMNALTP